MPYKKTKFAWTALGHFYQKKFLCDYKKNFLTTIKKFSPNHKRFLLNYEKFLPNYKINFLTAIKSFTSNYKNFSSQL